MATWKRVVAARIRGRVFDPTTEQDWPPTGARPRGVRTDNPRKDIPLTFTLGAS